MIKSWISIIILILLPVFHASGIENQTCFDCHDKPDLKPETEHGQSLDLHISKGFYQDGKHRDIKCTGCHQSREENGFEKVPHLLESMPLDSCQGCHKPIRDQYFLSIHAKQQAGDFQCISCHKLHKTFDLNTLNDGHSLHRRISESNASCESCHREAVKSSDGSLINGIEHAHLVLDNPNLHLNSLRCVDCHTNPSDMGHHRIEAKDTIVDCTNCHQEYSKPYLSSIHVQNASGDFSCSSCHTGQTSPRMASEATEVSNRISSSNERCLNCHSTSQESSVSNRQIPDISRAHQALIQSELHLESVRCVDCHADQSDSSNHRIMTTSAVTQCVSCHNVDSLLLTKLYGPLPKAKDNFEWLKTQLHRETGKRIEIEPAVVKLASDRGIQTPLSAGLFDQLYLTGASRIALLDEMIPLIFGIVLILVAVHGGLRFIGARLRPQGPFEVEEEEFYSLLLRIWHWLNALVIIVLLVTGFAIHFTDKTGSLIDFSVATRMHQILGGVLVVLYLYYLLSSMFNGNIKQYIPGKKGFFRRLIDQVIYYAWGIFIKAPKPFHPRRTDKFNELQRISYAGVMFILFPILIVSGLGLMVPSLVPDSIFGISGLFATAMIHYTVAACFGLFLLIHVYQITTGDKVSFLLRAMITGIHRSLKHKNESRF